MNPFLLASDHETRVFILLNTTGHMNATVLAPNSFSSKLFPKRADVEGD